MDNSGHSLDLGWMFAPGWIAFAIVDFFSTSSAPASLAEMLIAKLPALLGVGLGYAHWYTNQRDRSRQMSYTHSQKMAEIARKQQDKPL